MHDEDILAGSQTVQSLDAVQTQYPFVLLALIADTNRDVSFH